MFCGTWSTIGTTILVRNYAMFCGTAMYVVRVDPHVLATLVRSYAMFSNKYYVNRIYSIMYCAYP